MVEPKNMRFGEFIKYKRLKDPRNLTSKDVSSALNMSLSMLSDIEQGRKRAFSDERVVKFCEYLNLCQEDLNLMRDLSAKDKREIPADIENLLMYTEIGDMARYALRLTNDGYGDENDWKWFIKHLKDKKRNE